MNADLLLVLGLVVACVGLFIIDKPRMDVVALLVIVILPLTGIINMCDSNVVLIAALFVIGEGLTRAGISYRLSDALIRMAGNSDVRLLVPLMLAVAGLGSVMALIGCLMMGLFRCIDMDGAYRSISWKILLLIVGVMPFAVALERTSRVDLAVNGLLHLVGEAGPHMLLASLFVLTAAIGLFISNTATAVLMMTPIALSPPATSAPRLILSP